MRNGNLILGWGMATCTWPATQHNAASPRAPDGRWHCTRILRHPGHRHRDLHGVCRGWSRQNRHARRQGRRCCWATVRFHRGQPPAVRLRLSTVLPAIAKATEKAMDAMLKAAPQKLQVRPFTNADPKTLKMTGGRIHVATNRPTAECRFQEILVAQETGRRWMGAQDRSTPEQKKYALHSFGAHFCEVSFDPEVCALARDALGVGDRWRSHDQREDGAQPDSRRRGDGHRHGPARRNHLRSTQWQADQQQLCRLHGCR